MGKNVSVEYRWGEDDTKRLDRIIDELLLRNVDLLVASGGSPAALAAKAAIRETVSRRRWSMMPNLEEGCAYLQTPAWPGKCQYCSTSGADPIIANAAILTTGGW